MAAGPGALLFLAGALVRLGLIQLYPGLPIGDALARLFYSDSILLAYQLPLPQLLVAAGHSIGLELAGQRLASSLLGALVGWAVYRLFLLLVAPSSALAGGALFALNPMLLFYSSLPYQEPLMIIGLALGLRTYVLGRRAVSAGWVSVACLARFEAWIAAALFCAAALRCSGHSEAASVKHPRRWLDLASSGAYVVVPVAWLLLRGGLAPPGSYVLDPAFDLSRLQRIPFLVKTVLVAATPPVIALSLWGLPQLARTGRRTPALRAAALFLGLFLIALVAFGHSYPIGSPLVVDREAHLILIAVCLAAGVGWTRFQQRIARHPRRRQIEALAAVLVLAGLGLQTVRYYRQRSAGPRQRRALAAAAALDRILPSYRRALVLAPPPPPKPLALYLEKMGAAGPAQLSAARAMVERYGRPSDLQLLALQLSRGRERLIAFDQVPPRTGLAAWLGSQRISAVVVFPGISDWPQPPGASLPRAWLEQLRPNLELVEAIQIEGESVEIFHRTGPGARRAPGRIPPPRRFADVAAGAGVAFAGRSEGAAWGDLDRDGDFDLIVTVDGGRPRLYRNDSIPAGPMRFEEVGQLWGLTWPGRAFGAAWADWDADGDSDLAISAWPRPLLYRNDGASLTEIGERCGIASNLRSQGLAWFDLEGDFVPELLIAGLDGTRLYRFGEGGCEDVTARWGLDRSRRGVGVAFTSETNGTVRLAIAGEHRSRYLRLGGAGFQPLESERAAGPAAWLPERNDLAVGVCWGDARGAGAFDLLETRFRRGNRYYRSSNQGALHEAAQTAGLAASRTSIGCAWGDVDLDGDQDLFVANEEVDALYLNQREAANPAAFREVALWLGLADPDENVGCAFADADRDGDLDLFVANYSGPDRLFENRGPERALRVRALTPAGAAAVGALVTVRLRGGAAQIQQIDGGSGFASQAAPELLFSVPAGAPAEVQVLFPNRVTVTRQAATATTLSIQPQALAAAPE